MGLEHYGSLRLYRLGLTASVLHNRAQVGPRRDRYENSTMRCRLLIISPYIKIEGHHLIRIQVNDVQRPTYRSIVASTPQNSAMRRRAEPPIIVTPRGSLRTEVSIPKWAGRGQTLV